MERMVAFEDISDGKKYLADDLVKANCMDCRGCFACCQGMGDSIVLDPLDIFRMHKGVGKSFEELLGEGAIELGVKDGIILPNITMQNKSNACAFLDENGRCSIHKFRPGICRLFPLGRIYEEDTFYYFLQVNECKKKDRSKIKVKQWIDVLDLERYEEFVLVWHNLLKNMKEFLREDPKNAALSNKICTMLLKTFYLTPYNLEGDFYQQFNERLNKIARL